MVPPGRKRRPESVLTQRGGAVELLRVPATLFGWLSGVRGRLYDRGWLPVAHVDVPVVSVGNLSAGGTGKTPFVQFLVQRLSSLGYRPGVLSRGYGGSGGSGESGGHSNDESRMLAGELGDLPLVENPDRIAGARRLMELGADLILLDDGFQHRRLARDLDLVLVDATRPWGLPASAPGEAHLKAFLPRGLLRERPETLGRADAVVLSRSDQVRPAERDRLLAELERIAPGIALLTGRHAPVGLRGPGGSAADLAQLEGREVDLVSALGNPDGFESTVRSLGASIHEHRRFPDHHPYAAGDLDGLGGADRWLVTSAKDAVKLEDQRDRLHVLEVSFELDRGAGVLDALLESLPRSRARESLHEGLHG